MDYTYRLGETAEPEGSDRIVYTPLHLSDHPKGMSDNEWFWLTECRKRIRRYDTTWL